jgi:hypothetical protein
MDSKQIGQLLEKYWNCETSLEEEQQLRTYFNGTGVPENLKEAADLFRFFESERQRSLNDNFESEVTQAMKKSDRGAKVVSMVRWVQVARIAAGLFVVVAASYFVNKEIEKKETGTITDPKVALEETKKAFMMISKSFNKARDGAGKINLFNEAEQKITGKEEEKKSGTDSTKI